MYDVVLEIAGPMFVACMAQDVETVDAIVTPVIAAYGTAGKFTVCSAFASAFTELTGLRQLQDSLTPGEGQSTFVLLRDVTMYGENGYHERREAARWWVSTHMRSQDDDLYQRLETDADDAILHGLCELLASWYHGQQPS